MILYIDKMLCDNENMKKIEEIDSELSDVTQDESLFAKSKRATMNGWSRIKFFFSAIILLATFAFSLINVLFKIKLDGFTTPTIILSVATGMYLIVLLLYWILLKSRLKGKDDWKLKETVYYTKYLIRIIKVAVPVILLFNLLGKPWYDIIIIGFSSISITFGLISFFIATIKVVKRIKTREKRKTKHDEKYAKSRR